MATAFMEDDLTCSICLALFHMPKILIPCLHSFCKGCITDHITKTQINNTFKCPLCKECLHLPSNSVEGLKDDFRLKSIVERFAAHDGRLFCGKHPSKELTIFCFVCKELICSECMSASHRMHDHDDIDHAVKKAKEKIKRNEEAVEEALDIAEISEAKIASAQKCCDDQEQGMTQFVATLFDDVLSEFTEHKDELLNMCRPNELCESIRRLLGKGLSVAQQRQELATDLSTTAHAFFKSESKTEKMYQYENYITKLERAKFVRTPPKQPEQCMHMPASTTDTLPITPVQLFQGPERVGFFRTKKEQGRKTKTIFHDICFTRGKFIIVNSGRVEIFTKEGTFHSRLHTKQLCHPYALAINSNNGGVYVASPKNTVCSSSRTMKSLVGPMTCTLEYQGIRIASYDANFKFSGLINNKGRWFDKSRIAYKSNTIIVAGGGVLLFINANKVEKIVDKKSLGLDTFSPSDVFTSPSGNIVTTDHESGCVYILDCLGNRILHTQLIQSGVQNFSLALLNQFMMTCDERGHIISLEFFRGPKVEDKLHVEPVNVEGEILKFVVMQLRAQSKVCAMTICGTGRFAVLYEDGTVEMYKYFGE